MKLEISNETYECLVSMASLSYRTPEAQLAFMVNSPNPELPKASNFALEHQKHRMENFMLTKSTPKKTKFKKSGYLCKEKAPYKLLETIIRGGKSDVYFGLGTLIREVDVTNPYDLIKNLTKKGYLQKDGRWYRVTEKAVDLVLNR